MPDQKEAPVERHKLSPGFLAWTKSLKATNRMREMLTQASLKHKAKGDQLQQLWQQLSASAKGVAEAQPKDTVQELEGMNFPSEGDQAPQGGPGPVGGAIRY